MSIEPVVSHNSYGETVYRPHGAPPHSWNVTVFRAADGPPMAHVEIDLTEVGAVNLRAWAACLSRAAEHIERCECGCPECRLATVGAPDVG